MLEEVTAALAPDRQTSPAPGECILWWEQRMDSELKWQKVNFSTSFFFPPTGAVLLGLKGVLAPPEAA